MRLLALLIFSATFVGCSPATKASFDVSIRNRSSGPLTVGFVKRGSPFEQDWASPEELTNLPPSRQPSLWGFVVEQGKTAEVRVHGEFSGGASAYLRVYAGDHPLVDLLAMSRGTGSRLDIALQPGRNNAFVITDPGAKLTAQLSRPERTP